jgi:hypothetical protein
MRDDTMRGWLALWLVSLWLLSQGASAQPVIRDDEHLASDRPEAWAMNYFAASSIMTAFGEGPALEPGHWDATLELGHVPSLSDAQRRVGFNGFKTEDLNRSPVFGRLRLFVGLPAGWVAELGYTPPLSIDGARARNLVAVAVGRRVIARNGYTLSTRIFGQHGEVRGDITCPGGLAGVMDAERNPFGCQAASNDRIRLNYYGVDLTAGWSTGSWHWHGSLGAVRTEPEVQVDALTFDVRDRSRLVARDVLPFIALGASRDIDTHWSLGMEVLHVPLAVRRNPGMPREHDPLTSLRLQLRYRGR